LRTELHRRQLFFGRSEKCQQGHPALFSG
jgi:hypothetical protein